jgi:hypothetical protein
MNKLIIIINSIIVIIILAFIIYWLNKIKACVCASKIAEKNYLGEWFIYRIVITVIYTIIITNDDLSNSIIGTNNHIFYIIITIIDLIMLIRLFIYIKKMRELNCNCGMLETQNYIYNYLIIVFSIVSFVLFIFLLIWIYILIMRFSKRKNKKIR